MGYILFSSECEFSILAFVRWNGIIEYSYDNKQWNIWHGEKIINKTICMRGINNTVISQGDKWIINGKNVRCQGNIENLLDYKSVINNVHPKMKSYCFGRMFADCSALIEAPQLLSIELPSYCYSAMFFRCTALQHVPQLAKRLANKYAHYCWMFKNCSEIINSQLPMTEVNFPSLRIAKDAIVNQNILKGTSIIKININNKLYDINVVKLF